jgi:hypothetical protein
VNAPLEENMEINDENQPSVKQIWKSEIQAQPPGHQDYRPLAAGPLCQWLPD